MKKRPSKSSKEDEVPKRTFQFYLGSRERYIKIDSNFDSGNINLVKQLTQFSYRLQSVHDGTRTGNRVNSKSWFHFSVEGFPKSTKGKFTITKVQTLASVYYSKYNRSFRPVFRVEGKDWKRLETEAELIFRENGQLECVFEYHFKNEEQKVYFAFNYPYSFCQHMQYMGSLNDYISNDQFYLHKEVFIKSPENRDIHLLTITSYDHPDTENQKEDLFDDLLFPEQARPLRFKKPVILISARVHPGQTPASYAMEGVINFLTNKNDLRANLLRKMFVFMIVPMINVDGVYHGHFRMDLYGKNLNRFYLKPDPSRQPAVYAIKELATHLTNENRLSFYFDLHAHNAKKGCFIYGNAINDFVEQVESQVFCKLFAQNHKGFEYNYCNFSQKHMNAKDFNEDMTKEGCGRVVMHRMAKIIHSYSLECGIISPNTVNVLPDPINQEFKVKDLGFVEDPCENNKHKMYHYKGDEGPLFTEDMYRNLGKNMLVSVLDVFDKNPYNRVYNSQYKSMDMLRRITAFEIFHNTERFRMFERFVYGKVKNINELIKEVLKEKLNYKQLYNFYFFDDKELKDITWPESIPGLCKPIIKINSPSKLRRFRSLHEPKKDYEYEFMEILKRNREKNDEEEEMNASRINFEASKQAFHHESPLRENREDNFYSRPSSKSSETDDQSPQKTQTLNFDEAEFFNQEVESGQKYISPSDRMFSNALLEKTTKPKIECASMKLQEIQVNYKQTDKNGTSLNGQNSESPSVRVRRLLKQENLAMAHFKDSRESKQILQSEQEPRVQSGGIFNRDSLIESIKQDIKLELQREQQRKMSDVKVRKNYLSHLGTFGDKREQSRAKSTSMRKQSTQGIGGSKIQLPSLGTQFFLISTSNKNINKKF